jgi:predicted anti-sigma-YlaC factor YlaD
MVLKCEDIWREVSNYIDGDVDPQLKVAMEQHIAGCQKCRAVLAGSLLISTRSFTASWKIASKALVAGRVRRGFWQSPPRSFSPLRFGL